MVEGWCLLFGFATIWPLSQVDHIIALNCPLSSFFGHMLSTFNHNKLSCWPQIKTYYAPKPLLSTTPFSEIHGANEAVLLVLDDDLRRRRRHLHRRFIHRRRRLYRLRILPQVRTRKARMITSTIIAKEAAQFWTRFTRPRNTVDVAFIVYKPLHYAHY